MAKRQTETRAVTGQRSNGDGSDAPILDKMTYNKLGRTVLLGGSSTLSRHSLERRILELLDRLIAHSLR